MADTRMEGGVMRRKSGIQTRASEFATDREARPPERIDRRTLASIPACRPTGTATTEGTLRDAALPLSVRAGRYRPGADSEPGVPWLEPQIAHPGCRAAYRMGGPAT